MPPTTASFSPYDANFLADRNSRLTFLCGTILPNRTIVSFPATDLVNGECRGAQRLTCSYPFGMISNLVGSTHRTLASCSAEYFETVATTDDLCPIIGNANR